MIVEVIEYIDVAALITIFSAKLTSDYHQSNRPLLCIAYQEENH